MRRTVGFRWGLALGMAMTACGWAATATPVVVTVTDSTGAAIAGAECVAEAAGGGSVRAVTDGGGVARLATEAGVVYRLRVRAQGFEPVVEELGQGVADLKVELKVGSAAETVEVQAQAGAVVDAQQTQMGLELDAQQVANVPLSGRSLTDLLAVTAGVVPVSSAQANAVVMSGVASTPPSGDLDAGSLSVSGQRETANAFRVNGADVLEDVNMGIAVVPTLDSVESLEVLTGSFDAKLGNQSGGQVEVTTWSGGERMHGSVYDYVRETALDARSYFSLTRAPFHLQRFGGTLGGPTPVRAVKFFADFQGTRQTQGVDTGLIAVPTVEDRAGVLGDAAGSLTGTVSGDGWAQALAARLGYAVASGEPYYAQGCVTVTACVFPGGTIPERAWSAPAVNLLRYIPQANVGTNGFETSSVAQTLRDAKGALRLDAALRAGQLSVYGFVDDYSMDNPYPGGQGGASVPGFAATNVGRAQLYDASLVTALGANLVNTAQVSYLRNQATVGQPEGGQGVSLAAQGFATSGAGIIAQAPQIVGVENVVFNDFTMGTTVTGLEQAENTMEASDDVERVWGRHTVSVGVGLHADQINTRPDVYDNGSFSFTGSETGMDFADFLLGVDSSYTQGDGQNFYNRDHYMGVYAQDSWRVRQGLVLNYGLRWDVLPPWRETYNQLLSLDPGEQSVVFPKAPQGILFPGDPGVPDTISPTRYGNLTPRLGASWSPAGRIWGAGGTTVVRAGFGMYFSGFEGLSAGIMSGNPPYGLTDTTAAPTRFETPFVEAATGQSLGQPFPLQAVPFGASAEHPVTTVDWTRYEPLTGIPAFAKDNLVPFTENYTLAVERQLTPATVLKASYVGTQAHHLLVIQEVNPGDAALCLALSQPSEVAAGSATCGPFNESSTFTAANGTVHAGTRTAFSSAFGSVNLQRTIANSHDNALEVELRHQSQRLFVQVAYTWSKSIDESSSLAEAVMPGNAGLSRAISAFDMTHNLVATYHYALPLELVTGRFPRLLRGWEVSGLTRLGTGLPVTLENNNNTSLLGTAPNGINGNGIDEPEFAGGALELQHRPGRAAFNTALFSLPALGTLGNARRRFFAGRGWMIRTWRWGR
jgi:hypothetical protein